MAESQAYYTSSVNPLLLLLLRVITVI